jgi:hypothetical protein
MAADFFAYSTTCLGHSVYEADASWWRTEGSGAPVPGFAALNPGYAVPGAAM